MSVLVRLTYGEDGEPLVTLAAPSSQSDVQFLRDWFRRLAGQERRTCAAQGKPGSSPHPAERGSRYCRHHGGKIATPVEVLLTDDDFAVLAEERGR